MFAFQVSWNGGETISFQEVSGLDSETQTIDYRGGNRPGDATIKKPGIRKYGDITLKRGVFASERASRDWIARIKSNLIQRATVIIELVDAAGKPRMRWKLKNAFPAKFTGPTLNAKGNDVALETLVLAHEGLTREDD
jgi:phage tail-like protein